MVKLEGSYTFDAPQDVVWDAVQDPNVLSQVLPGCERLEQIGQDEYEGEINIRVGPVQGTFKGTVKLSEITPPHSYQLSLEGQGRPGFVKGAGELRLSAQGEQTVLRYNGEAQLSGRIASVGQRLVDSTARSITRQGLESLDRQIQARLHPQPQAAAPSPAKEASPSPAQPKPQPAAAPPSQMEVGMTVAKDVASDLVRDLAEERSFKGRDVAIIVSAVLAVLWMWNRLFGKD